MLGLPASHRARMRLLWGLVAAGIAAALGLVVALFPNTGHSFETPLSDQPAKILREPKHVRPTPKTVREARATLDAFVRSAGIRRDLAVSWPLATPHMRVGVSRREWLAGNLPMSPYPAADFGSASYKLSYAYVGTLGFDVILRPRRSGGAQGGYSCELKRLRGRWLVDSCYGSPTPHGRVSPVINPGLG